MRRIVRRLLRSLGLIAGVLLLGLAMLLLLWRFTPPVSTLMVWSAVTGQGMARNYIPRNRISPHLINAVINAEDARFCLHSGVDWADLNAVLLNEDGPNRGASTITMQTAKNLFLWHKPLAYLRKALEIPLALLLDLVWPKSRVIEVYLNIAEWGPGLFGAEAASRHYFRKPAMELTRREAALLAAALPNPATRNPRQPTRWLSLHAGRIAERSASNPAGAACVQ